MEWLSIGFETLLERLSNRCRLCSLRAAHMRVACMSLFPFAYVGGKRTASVFIFYLILFPDGNVQVHLCRCSWLHGYNAYNAYNAYNGGDNGGRPFFQLSPPLTWQKSNYFP